MPSSPASRCVLRASCWERSELRSSGDADLHGPGPGGFHLGQMHLQNPVLVDGRASLALDVYRQGVPKVERPVATLCEMDGHVGLRNDGLALAPEADRVACNFQMDVLLAHPG